MGYVYRFWAQVQQVFKTFVAFFVVFSKQNINQSETGIGDQKLSMELYVNKHFAHM